MVVSVDHDPSNGCSDGILIEMGGFNETLNVNVAFLADPSFTDRLY